MTTVNSEESVRVEELEGGAIWRLYLDAPKANILDSVMIRGVTEVFRRAPQARGLKVICIEGAGGRSTGSGSLSTRR